MAAPPNPTAHPSLHRDVVEAPKFLPPLLRGYFDSPLAALVHAPEDAPRGHSHPADGHAVGGSAVDPQLDALFARLLPRAALPRRIIPRSRLDDPLRQLEPPGALMGGAVDHPGTRRCSTAGRLSTADADTPLPLYYTPSWPHAVSPDTELRDFLPVVVARTVADPSQLTPLYYAAHMEALLLAEVARNQADAPSYDVHDVRLEAPPTGLPPARLADFHAAWRENSLRGRHVAQFVTTVLGGSSGGDGAVTTATGTSAVHVAADASVESDGNNDDGGDGGGEGRTGSGSGVRRGATRSSGGSHVLLTAKRQVPGVSEGTPALEVGSIVRLRDAVPYAALASKTAGPAIEINATVHGW